MGELAVQPQDIIFTSQLIQRRTNAAVFAQARRRWLATNSWYPEDQNELYGNSHRIYKECVEKYGENIFTEYATHNRIYERLWAKGALDAVKSQQQETEPLFPKPPCQGNDLKAFEGKTIKLYK